MRPAVYRLVRMVFLGVVCLAAPAAAVAQTTYNVGDETALRNALTSVVDGDTIVFSNNITLTSDLPNVGVAFGSVTIDGGGFTLSGNNQYRGLFIGNVNDGTNPTTVAVQNITIANTVATGGTGGTGVTGGGGGAGLGGALFIGDAAQVTVSNVNIVNSSAVGGNGGAGGIAGAASGGGGGLGGNGGAGDTLNGGGGGGGTGLGAIGGTAGASSGGNGILLTSTDATFAGGGAGGTTGSGGSGGGDFGGFSSGTSGGDGGFGGGAGGGGASGGAGGVGGFAGGGGGGNGVGFAAGNGGYGAAGGGGDISAGPGTGGAFGGSGSTTGGGGGGAGLGGAIFVQHVSSGSLTIAGPLTINGVSVTGGAGGDSGASAGLAAGSAIMLSGGAGVTFQPSAGQTITINGNIEDDTAFGLPGSAGSVHVNGPGTVILNGNNTYAGSTTVSTGTLQITSDANLGAATTDLELDNDANLVINGSFTASRNLFFDNWAGNLVIPTGQAVTWNGAVSEFNPSGFNLTGGGRLTLTSTSNFWSNATQVTGNSTLSVDDALQIADNSGNIILGDATSGGTLNVTTAGAFSSSHNVTLGAGGGTFDINSGADADFSGTIDGAGSLTKNGAGSMTLSGINSYTGATIVNGGLLTANSFSAFGGSTSLSIASGAGVDMNGHGASFNTISGQGDLNLSNFGYIQLGSDGSSSTFLGNISGTGQLYKLGTGNLSLFGSNTYSGGTYLQDGSLTIQGPSSIGTGNLRMYGGTQLNLTGGGTYLNGIDFGSSGTATLSVSPNVTANWSGPISDTASFPLCDCSFSFGSLKVAGGGTLVLGNTANGYAGGTTVIGNSELIVSADGALGSTFPFSGPSTPNSAPVFLGDSASSGTLGINATAFSSSRSIFIGAGGGAIDTVGSSNALWSGGISGSSSFTKNGTGSLTLAGSNSYTGPTIVNGGSLFAGSANAFGASKSLFVNTGGLIGFGGFSQNFDSIDGGGTVSFSGGETLSVGANNSTNSFAGALTGNGNLTKLGTGSLTLSGASTYTGLTTVSGGTLIAGSAGAFGNSRNFTVAGGATVDFNGFSQNLFSIGGTGTIALTGGANLTIGGDNGSTTFAGSLTGSGGLFKSGSGTFALSGANSYSGSTNVLGGILQAGNAAAFGTSRVLTVESGAALDLNGFSQNFFRVTSAGTLALNGGATLTVGADGSNNTIGGTITGSGGLVKAGAGSLTLTGVNSFAGGLTVNAGTLAIKSDANLGASNALLTLGSSTSAATLAIDAGGSFLSSRPIVIGGLGAIVDTVGGTDARLSGNISGQGGITKIGLGSLTLTGNNTFAGAFAVNGGTLRAGGRNVFAPGVLSLASGTTVDLNGFDQEVGSLTGSGSLVLGGGAFLTLGGDNSNTLFGGPVSGSGGLIKVGNGLLSLTGNNTYTGGLQVRGGTLLGNTSSLSGNIGNNATIVFDQAADGTYAGSMSGSGSLVKTGNGALTLAGTNSYTGGTLISAGTLLGNTSSLQGGFINNAALTFDQAGDGVFNGFITGTGSVTKLGQGNLTFNGANSFTGLTTIGQGTFTLNGSLAGNVNVGTQATLSGAGTIGGNLGVGGRLFVPSPTVTPALAASLTSAFHSMNQASVSSLMPFATRDASSLIILGDLNASQGSTLDFSVSQAGAAPILVNGRANLIGAHLNVTIDDPNPSRAATYTAIKALNGVNMAGTDGISPSTSILPVLTATQSSLLLTVLNLKVPVTGTATTRNGIAAGRGIDAVKNCQTGDLCDVVKEVLALDQANLDAALKQLAGEIHASSTKVVVNDARVMADLVRTQLSEAEHNAEDEPGGSAPASGTFGPLKPWVQFAGDHVSFKTGENSGGTANVGGGGGGFDFKPGAPMMAGFGGAFSLGSLSLSDISGKSTLKTPRAFGYTGIKFGPFHLHAGSSVSKVNNATNRNVNIHAKVPDENGNLVPLSNGIDRTADADENGYVQDVWSEWQHTKKWQDWLMDSKFGVRATRYVRRAFTESGAGSISLDGFEDVYKTRESHVDLNILKKRGAYRPHIVLNYLREFTDVNATVADVSFDQRPESQFQVTGVPIPRDLFHGLFGLTVRTLAGLEYTFEYETTQASNESHNSVHFRMRFK